MSVVQFHSAKAATYLLRGSRLIFSAGTLPTHATQFAERGFSFQQKLIFTEDSNKKK
jgi:hypothetical protein